MPAGTCGHRDQSVGALFDRLARKAVVDHIVQHDPAPAVRRLIDIFARAERGDQQRHLPLAAQCDVFFQPVVGLVHDLVDRKGCCGAIGMGAVVRGQFLGDLVQPFVQLADRARIERREAADNPRLALGNHHFRPGNDEQRRCDHRQTQIGKQRGQGHRRTFLIDRLNRSITATEVACQFIPAGSLRCHMCVRQCPQTAHVSRPPRRLRSSV